MVHEELREAISNYDVEGTKKFMKDYPIGADDVISLIFSAASDVNMPAELLELIIRVCPDKLIEIDELNFTPLHYALSDCLPFENIKILIEGNPKSLWIRDDDDLLPIHTLYYAWESHDDKETKSKVQKMKEHRELIKLMLHYYPGSAIAPCKAYGSILEQISSRKILEPKHSVSADPNPSNAVLDDLDWDIRMMILKTAHECYRKKNGQSPSNKFHPICAAIELLSFGDNFGMLNRVLDEFTWCHSLEKIKAMYPNPEDFERYGPTKNILEERLHLKMMIFCNRRDMYFNLLNKFPLGCLKNEFEYAFRMGRYFMVEQTITKYSELVCKPDDNGNLPVDLAESILQRNSGCCQFEHMLNLLREEIGAANRRKFVSPKQNILNLIKLHTKLALIPTHVLGPSDIQEISKGKKLRIGDKEFVVDRSCSTCLELYKVGDKVSWSIEETSTCIHIFHHECIMRWLSSKDEATCPACRQSFLPRIKACGQKRLFECDANTDQARTRSRTQYS